MVNGWLAFEGLFAKMPEEGAGKGNPRMVHTVRTACPDAFGGPGHASDSAFG